MTHLPRDPDILQSPVCLCGNAKKKGQALCKPCYVALQTARLRRTESPRYVDPRRTRSAVGNGW